MKKNIQSYKTINYIQRFPLSVNFKGKKIKNVMENLHGDDTKITFLAPM